MSVIEKTEFKAFLNTCYQEKIIAELGSEEAQVVIAEFKSNIRKHILNDRQEEYSHVYETSSIAPDIIVKYLGYNEVSFRVEYKYGQCTITVDSCE